MMVRHPISRMRRGFDDQPKYHHPNGWIITRGERDYGIVRGAAGQGAKVWWEVRKSTDRVGALEQSFRTLGEARAWCDERSAF